MTSQEAPVETQVGNDSGCGRGGRDVVRFRRYLGHLHNIHLFVYINIIYDI